MEEKQEKFFDTKKHWCEDSDNGHWNERKAETEIRFIKRFASFYLCDNEDNQTEKKGKDILENIFQDETYRAIVSNAAKEMALILSQKDNPLGYHLNHITSGQTLYGVFSTEGDKAYKTDWKEYKDKESAEANASTYPDAYTEQIIGADNHPIWIVWVMDAYETEQMKKLGVKHFVSAFDNLEDAEEEALHHENGSVEEYPSEEWWVVVNNKTGRRAFNILFPYETKALAFLYKAVWPKEWAIYQEVRQKRLAGRG